MTGKRLNFEDKIGEKFNYFTIVGHIGKNKQHHKVLCECICGKQTVVDYGNLRSGHSKSCGCKRSEFSSNRSNYHGMSRTKVRNAFNSILGRCYNPNNISYKNYGERGIVFEYVDNFKGFLEEVGLPPENTRERSIDRIDVNKGYVKGNMRWATPKQQAQNKTMLVSNTSGVTGVHWDNKRHPQGNKYTLYAVAQWTHNGKLRTKGFSVKKYGEDGAFAMACAYREKMIAELNEQGAEYSIDHGK